MGFWEVLNIQNGLALVSRETNNLASFIWILAAPGVKIVPTATGVVISQTAQVYQPHLIVQPAVPVIFIHNLRVYQTLAVPVS